MARHRSSARCWLTFLVQQASILPTGLEANNSLELKDSGTKGVMRNREDISEGGYGFVLSGTYHSPRVGRKIEVAVKTPSGIWTADVQKACQMLSKRINLPLTYAVETLPRDHRYVDFEPREDHTRRWHHAQRNSWAHVHNRALDAKRRSLQLFAKIQKEASG